MPLLIMSQCCQSRSACQHQSTPPAPLGAISVLFLSRQHFGKLAECSAACSKGIMAAPCVTSGRYVPVAVTKHAEPSTSPLFTTVRSRGSKSWDACVGKR